MLIVLQSDFLEIHQYFWSFFRTRSQGSETIVDRYTRLGRSQTSQQKVKKRLIKCWCFTRKVLNEGSL
jgi:hypothetical protein